jgi:hypothetical protein
MTFMSGDNRNVLTARGERLRRVWVARGFRNLESLARFVRIEYFRLHLFCYQEYVSNPERLAQQMGRHLGVSAGWLLKGAKPHGFQPHDVWFRKQARHIGRFGPTLYPHNAKGAPANVQAMVKPAAALIALPRPQRMLALPAPSRGIDPLWDPNGLCQGLPLLRDIAEGRHPEKRQPRYLTSVVDVARIGWCLHLDHLHGFTDRHGLRQLYAEFREHEEFGIERLIATSPPPPRAIIATYEGAIQVCREVIKLVAHDLDVDLSAFEPKTPAPDCFARRKARRHAL